jgi:hypothetical protein
MIHWFIMHVLFECQDDLWPEITSFPEIDRSASASYAYTQQWVTIRTKYDVVKSSDTIPMEYMYLYIIQIWKKLLNKEN